MMQPQTLEAKSSFSSVAQQIMSVEQQKGIYEAACMNTKLRSKPDHLFQKKTSS